MDFFPLNPNCTPTDSAVHPSPTDAFLSSIQALTITQYVKGINHSAPMDPLYDGTCTNKVRTRPFTAFSSECLRWQKAHHDCHDHDPWQPCQHDGKLWKVHITVGTCWKSSQDPNTFAGLASKFFRFLLASDESQASQAAGFPHHAPCDSMWLHVGPVVKTLRTSAVPGSANAKHAPQQTWSILE